MSEQSYGLKMAVARPEEVERAMNLAGILDDISRGHFPRGADGEAAEDDPMHFDEDNPDHLRELYERIMNCGNLWRVAIGYEVLTAPRNSIIDPDLSHLELHPRLREGLKAAQSPLLFWCRRVLRGAMEILKEGWNL